MWWVMKQSGFKIFKLFKMWFEHNTVVLCPTCDLLLAVTPPLRGGRKVHWMCLSLNTNRDNQMFPSASDSPKGTLPFKMWTITFWSVSLLLRLRCRLRLIMLYVRCILHHGSLTCALSYFTGFNKHFKWHLAHQAHQKCNLTTFDIWVIFQSF